MKGNKSEYLLLIFITIVSVSFALLYEKLLIDMKHTDLMILVGIFFAIVILCVTRNLLRKGSDPYEIINPILLIYSLYAMMLPLNYLISLNIPTFDINVPGVAILPMFQFIVICMIGLAGLIIGYYLPFGRQCGQKIPVWKISMRELKIAAFILLIYGLLSFATNIAGYGGFSNFIKVGYGAQRYVIQRQALAFGQGLELVGIAAILLMFVTFKEKRRRWFIIILVFILLCITIISLLIGQRRFIVYLMVMAFIILNYGIFRIKLKWSLIAIALSYCFLFIYAHSRSIWAEFGLIQGLVETYNIAVKNPTLFLPFAGGEFIPPTKVILEILLDNSFQFKYGSSYIIGLIRILPRVGKIWPEALQTLAQWRMDTYYPGLYARGVNFIFFTPAEGYANFGYLGVFFHMAFYGFIAKLAYSYFRKNRANTLILVIYAGVFSLMTFEGIHAEFSQVLWYATHTYLGPMLLMIGAAKFFDYVCKNRL